MLAGAALDLGHQPPGEAAAALPRDHVHARDLPEPSGDEAQPATAQHLLAAQGHEEQPAGRLQVVAGELAQPLAHVLVRRRSALVAAHDVLHEGVQRGDGAGIRRRQLHDPHRRKVLAASCPELTERVAQEH